MRLKAPRLESALVEEAASRAVEGVDLLDDLHASAEFCGHLARLYPIKAIKQASSGR